MLRDKKIDYIAVKINGFARHRNLLSLDIRNTYVINQNSMHTAQIKETPRLRRESLKPKITV